MFVPPPAPSGQARLAHWQGITEAGDTPEDLSNLRMNVWVADQ